MKNLHTINKSDIPEIMVYFATKRPKGRYEFENGQLWVMDKLNSSKRGNIVYLDWIENQTDMKGFIPINLPIPVNLKIL